MNYTLQITERTDRDVITTIDWIPVCAEEACEALAEAIEKFQSLAGASGSIHGS